MERISEKLHHYYISFSLGLLWGWLYPVEGPLDWTYDEYASYPAHCKGPSRVAPPIREEKEIEEVEFEEDLLYNSIEEEDGVINFIKNLLP